jgi:hypothetical protein
MDTDSAERSNSVHKHGDSIVMMMEAFEQLESDSVSGVLALSFMLRP